MSWTRSTRCCAFICIILLLQTIKMSNAIAYQCEQNQIDFEPPPDDPAPTITSGGGRR
jgi:hypothetical protein